MPIEEYRQHLLGQGLAGDRIEEQAAIVGELVAFLAARDAGEAAAPAGRAEVEAFARGLIAQGRNTMTRFEALRDYAGWLGHRSLYVGFVELLDCHNALEVLAERITERHGRTLRDRVFPMALPPLGAGERERCEYTRGVTERMTQALSPEARRAAWYLVEHGIPPEVWERSDAADREVFRRCGDVDTFLDLKQRERDALLTRLRDEDRLWYTIAIDDEVLEFVRSNPELEGGRREGNRVYITKIPYNARRYLHESDHRLKRYFACHCPLAREAILHDLPISSDVCACSLGHASHYLAGLGQAIEGEVLESAVRGDLRCRFVFYLPDDAAGNTGSTAT